MPRSTFAMVVAILSTLMHIALLIITILGIIQEVQSNKSYRKYGFRSSSRITVMLTLLIVALIVEIILLVTSICLIVGIQKKRPHFISPWLYISIGYVILSIADFVGGFNVIIYLFPIKLVVATLHVALWYPVFKYLSYLRIRLNEQFTVIY